MAAMFGGLVGQELVKACTGKFQPLNQYFYFDSVESLPKGFPLAAEEYAPVGSRYDSQIAVFGKTLQDKIATLKVFLVGAGALGYAPRAPPSASNEREQTSAREE